MKNKLVKKVVEKSKKEDTRITPQRYAVLEYLTEHHLRPTADEIYKTLEHRFPNVSVATVYNSFRLLISIGFVQEMKYDDVSSQFDFSSGCRYHVVCKNCGKIVDFYYPGLEGIEVTASRLASFEIDEHRSELYGLCPGRKKSAKRAQM